MKYIYREEGITLDDFIEIPDGSIAVTIIYDDQGYKTVSWLEPKEEP